MFMFAIIICFSSAALLLSQVFNYTISKRNTFLGLILLLLIYLKHKEFQYCFRLHSTISFLVFRVVLDKYNFCWSLWISFQSHGYSRLFSFFNFQFLILKFSFVGLHPKFTELKSIYKVSLYLLLEIYIE